MTREHLKALAKEHAVEVLDALTKVDGGLSWTTLNYEVVKSSATTGVLKALVDVGLVTKESDIYRITDDGREALHLCQPILELGGK